MAVSLRVHYIYGDEICQRPTWLPPIWDAVLWSPSPLPPSWKTDDDGLRVSRAIMSWGVLLLAASSCALFAQSVLAVTVYGQTPLGATQTLPPGATYTGLPAYDPTVLNPPPIAPIPGPYSLQLTNDVNAVGGVSIPLNGSFYGFSIEMSVVNQIRESTQRPVQLEDFLNVGTQSEKTRVSSRFLSSTSWLPSRVGAGRFTSAWEGIPRIMPRSSTPYLREMSSTRWPRTRITRLPRPPSSSRGTFSI